MALISGFKIPFNFGSVGLILLIFFIFLIIAILIGALAFFIWRHKQYRFSIPLWIKVDNQWVRAITDKARKIKAGIAGEYLLKLKKQKIYLPMPRILAGIREYMYFRRKDGEWVNFKLRDIDEQLKEADVFYEDEDMRLSRISTERLLRQILLKKNWLTEYLPYIAIGLFMLLLVIALIVLFSRLTGTADAITAMADSTAKVAMELDEMQKANLNPDRPSNVKNSSSGLVKVT